MKLTETRRIDTGLVRNMCITNDFYTRGTTEEYGEMFRKCAVARDILEIALDIFEHSDEEKLTLRYGSKKEALENICYSLINDCCYTCVDVEE